jgi:cytochrome P450
MLIALTLGFLSSLFWLYQRLKPHPVDDSLPGPERWPFLGILLTFIANREKWPEVANQYSEKFGYGRVWGGPVPKVGALWGAYFVLTSEENIEYILNTNFQNYVKGNFFRDVLEELLGNGIFVADGPTWYRHRKIASRMFSRNLLKETANVTLSKVKELCLVLSGKVSASLDIQDLFFRMTFDIISFVAFGVEYRSIAGNSQHPFALAFDEMQELLLERVGDPLFRVKKKLNLTEREHRIRSLKTVLDTNAHAVISSRRRTVENGKSLGPDILSRFIEYARLNKEPVPDEELRDVVMNIMVAGRDTTACALSWAIYELTKHPEVERKIVEEVDAICGKGVDGDYSFDTIASLTYTDAVIMEVLRLHPSVPSDVKYAVRDDQLPDGTKIPAGSVVGYPPYVMGRNSQVWGQDAQQFKPERFLNTTEPTPYLYPVFNAGKRFCLGKPMAIHTLKLTLAYLVPRFRFEDKQGHPGTYNWSLVKKMKGGFLVTVSKK